MSRLTPLNDRVVVEKLDAEKTLASGIILTTNGIEETFKGIVVGVGPGKKDSDGNHLGLDVTEGETIMFGARTGQKIKIDGKELYVLKEEEILAVIG